MTWAAILVLTALAFLFAAFVLKVGRGGWTLLGAALVFGLAGYAAQGSPEQPASPGSESEKPRLDGELLVDARREYFDTSKLPARWILTGDGFARRGDHDRAAGFYLSATQENPRDAEAWLALGIALVEHGEGNLTPAALLAFERAQQLDPANGGARYFLGFAWLRAGEVDRTLELWKEAFEKAPEDAPWREALAERIVRLEAMLGASSRAPAAE